VSELRILKRTRNIDKRTCALGKILAVSAVCCSHAATAAEPPNGRSGPETRNLALGREDQA
jgi:hypothetical protein